MPPVARLALLLTYAVLFLAAAGRSSIQLATKAAEAPVPYALSAAAAIVYGVVALALWRMGARLPFSTRWGTVALAGTSVELAGVLIVGAWGILEPGAWPDETVWSGFGSGYGWIPLALPPLALWALLRARRAAPA